MTIKALLSDLFGVIAQTQPAQAQERLVRISGVAAEQFWPAYWHYRPGYDQGVLTPLGYWNSVAQNLSTRFSTSQLMELHAADLDSWSLLNQPMVDALPLLRATGLRMGLLSNIPTSLAEHMRATTTFLDEFDTVALSCEIGLVKPSPQAYLWCIERLNFDARDTMFIDDTPANVEAVRAVGLQARLFTTVDDLWQALDLRRP